MVLITTNFKNIIKSLDPLKRSLHCILIVALLTLLLNGMSALAASEDVQGSAQELVVNAELLKKRFPPISGREAKLTSIQPNDVYVRLKWCQDLLKLISEYMGYQNDLPGVLEINTGLPREVIFQVHNFVDKTVRLEQQVGSIEEAPSQLDQVDVAKYKPYHVWLYATESLYRLEKIAAKLSIQHSTTEGDVTEGVLPKDVYTIALELHRNIDRLLIPPMTQANVFSLVTQAVNIMGDLITEEHKLNPYPEKHAEVPAFVSHQVVFKKILELVVKIKNYDPINAFAIENGDARKKNYYFKVFNGKTRSISAGDCYSMMQLIISDLVHLHNKSFDTPPLSSYDVGVKYPRDTYQRLLMLEKQIDTFWGDQK